MSHDLDELTGDRVTARSASGVLPGSGGRALVLALVAALALAAPAVALAGAGKRSGGGLPTGGSTSSSTDTTLVDVPICYDG